MKLGEAMYKAAQDNQAHQPSETPQSSSSRRS